MNASYQKQRTVDHQSPPTSPTTGVVIHVAHQSPRPCCQLSVLRATRHQPVTRGHPRRQPGFLVCNASSERSCPRGLCSPLVLTNEAGFSSSCNCTKEYGPFAGFCRRATGGWGDIWADAPQPPHAKAAPVLYQRQQAAAHYPHKRPQAAIYQRPRVKATNILTKGQ